MNRYHPLKSNATNTPALYIDAHTTQINLFENACFRIKAGTSLLETLTSVTIQHTTDIDLFRLILPAYLLLQDGVDTLEQINFKVE